MQAAAPSPLTPAQVEQILKDTARPFPAPARAVRRGHRQRQGGGRCRGRWRHHTAATDRRHADQRRTGDRPVRRHGQLGQLHDGRAGGREQPDLHHLRRHRRCGPVREVRQRADRHRATTAVRTCRAMPRPAPSPRPAPAPTTCASRPTPRFSGVSLTGSYTTGGGGGTQTYTNGTDYRSATTPRSNSPITVSGRSGNAPSSTPVAVNIVHTYKGDLKVDLVAPDGSSTSAQPHRRQCRQHHRTYT